MTIKQQIDKAPSCSGVYRFLDSNDKALYVGKAKDLKKRLLSYVDPKRLNNRISRMVSLAVKVEVTPTVTESEALLLECNLIKKLKPRYNILLRDDKSFPYILITKDHPFPQITKHRGKKSLQGHYFGPFASANDVNTTIDILKKAFRLRSCSDSEFARRTKPCLEYQIKRCTAPCVEAISKKDYKDSVNEALDFLNGKNSKIQEELAAKMQQYSQLHQYEQAAMIRDRIKALSSIQATQNINLDWLKNSDIITMAKDAHLCCIYISFYRNGHNYGSKPYFMTFQDGDSDSDIISAFLGQFYLEQTPPKDIILSHQIEDLAIMEQFLSGLAKLKVSVNSPMKGDRLKLVKNNLALTKQQLQNKLNEQLNHKNMLAELKLLLKLESDIKRVEVYDNSHIAGQDMVGAMIVAGGEGFIKNAYRKFNIDQSLLQERDDTAMLKQVLRRRFSQSSKSNKDELGNVIKPDLIIIDGGKGQLSATKEVFDELEITDQAYVCMSKGPNRNAGEEYFHQIGKKSFTLPKSNPVMFYLQNLRDEAHRFAIGTHRKKRAKSMIKSELDEVPNIGKNRKTLLLNHFGSVAAIKEASLEDLERVNGISKNIAKVIRNYFNTE